MKKNKSDEKFGTLQSDFIDLASHQLRTPLSGMRWLLELLQKGDMSNLSKKQKDYLEKIYASNERMIALVNDVLEVTRLENGETKLYFLPTELDTIIKGLIKEKERLIRKKRLTISFNVEQEPFPEVKTEPNKIKQAIGNLLSNAITYTGEGGHIKIHLERLDGMALVKVEDNGAGIPKDQQNQVFRKFFRGSNILNYENVGTGLGLYITKAFIENSGGKIWFKSQEGKGTSFYFTLPIIK
ncbi:MAG: sensor histidine kinase [Candidatus Saccharibacteria bacterium]